MTAAQKDSEFEGTFKVIRSLGESGRRVAFVRPDGDWAPGSSIVALPAATVSTASTAQVVCAKHLSFSLRNDSVIRIDSITTAEQGPVEFSAQKAAGRTLGQLLADEERFHYLIALEYLVVLCELVGYALVSGLPWSDIDPSRVFIVHEPQGGYTMTLLDFGVANSLLDSTNPRPVGVNVPLASLRYWPPERVSKTDVYEETALVWELGALAYEMITGHPPVMFQNISDLVGFHQSEEEVKGVRVHVPTIPYEIEKMIMKTLKKKPEERFPSVAGLLEQVRILCDLANQAVDSNAAMTARPLSIPVIHSLPLTHVPSTSPSPLHAPARAEEHVTTLQSKKDAEDVAAIVKKVTRPLAQTMESTLESPKPSREELMRLPSDPEILPGPPSHENEVVIVSRVAPLPISLEKAEAPIENQAKATPVQMSIVQGPSQAPLTTGDQTLGVWRWATSFLLLAVLIALVANLLK